MTTLETRDLVLWRCHLALVDSDPLVWRQIVIDAAVDLAALHAIAQAAMGWHNRHPYRFRRRGVLADLNPSTPLLHLGLHPQDTLIYTYDFHSGWVHCLTLEAIATEADLASTPVPQCLAGEGACPPEDCGGVWGYEELLERLSDPDDPEYTVLCDRVGWNFDPDAFDLQAANQRLQTLPMLSLES